MIEEWKDINGYENFYQISNLGHVKSLSRKVNAGIRYNSKVIVKERILKPIINSYGYETVMLSKNNKKKIFLVHRLVSYAFIPNKYNKKEVNHINGVKTDNTASNLEWCTRSENQQHAYDNNLEKRKFGKNNPMAKQVYQYDLKWNFIKEWDSVNDAIRGLGLKSPNIHGCCKGTILSSGGYKWSYEKF